MTNIKIGDYVEIVGGDCEGLQGFVIGIGDSADGKLYKIEYPNGTESFFARDCRVVKNEIVHHNDITKPRHYNQHPSKIECIQVTEHFNFNRGNAIKYIWRAGLKDHSTDIKDLKKAVWYLQREIERLENV